MEPLNEAADAAIDIVSKLSEKDLKVAPEKQYTNNDPWRAYACWFTAFHMYFRKFGLTKSWTEYRDACLAIGAIGRDFSILDYSDMPSKIAKAAGFTMIRRDTASNLSAKINELVMSGKPVPFSLNGEHYELITGKTDVQGRPCYTVADPGWQNDTYCDAESLQVFHIDNGKRSYSIGHNGKPRTITRIYWFEEIK